MIRSQGTVTDRLRSHLMIVYRQGDVSERDSNHLPPWQGSCHFDKQRGLRDCHRFILQTMTEQGKGTQK